MLLLVVTAAVAAPLHTPNSLLGVSAGTPTLVSVRGEAWMAEAASFEIGGGVPLETIEAWLDGAALGSSPITFDAVLRWRPRFLCVACERPLSASFGLGLGTQITPNVELLGPWTWALGPDVVATLVAWSSPTLGWHFSVRAGGGPEWTGNELRQPTPTFWAHGTLGLAF